MRVKDRSDYGERLFQARKHAGLTQEELAGRAGLAQSTLGELEQRGKGSAKTVRLAQVTGVRAEWLASEDGPMLAELDVPPSASRIASEKVAPYLINQNPAGADYRTIANALADALEESSTSISVRQFLTLVDRTYARLTGE